LEAPDLLPCYTREKAEQLDLIGYKTDTFSFHKHELVAKSGMKYDALGG
jgi:hypothetical protein